jgi:hypothetical protein
VRQPSGLRKPHDSGKVPEVRIIEPLPMTATGKVKKQELNG